MFKKEPYNFDELDHFCLGEQVNVRKKLGLIEIHVDEMDGHFVPNLSNVVVAGSARLPPKATRLKGDDHGKSQF
jgi:pentose-5-phosphate-3-epimerase